MMFAEAVGWEGVTCFFLMAYLATVVCLVRTERQIVRLMLTPARGGREGRDEGLFHHAVRGAGGTGGKAEWDALSWERKRGFMLRCQMLNWASAASGGAAFLAGVLWTGQGGVGHTWLWLGMLAVFIACTTYLACHHLSTRFKP